MSTFVEECRDEWTRLGVPDILADEMAGDLAADLAEAQSDGVPASEILGDSDPRQLAAAWASERGLVSGHPREGSHRRRWLLLTASLVLVVTAAIAVPLVLTSTGASHAPTFALHGPVTFEHTPAVEAMQSVFTHPSTVRIPASVIREVISLVKGAPAGAPDEPRGVLVHRGRLLLSILGPGHRAIYVFPTKNNEVCVVITGLSAGCKKAFILGQPAAVDGGNFASPPESGPPAELAGTTEDGVTGVSVVLNGKPEKAVFAHDAWYYRFPNNHIPGSAATQLLVTLSSGGTATVPMDNSPPKIIGPPK